MRAISRLQQKAAALEAEAAQRARVEAALAARERELSDFLESATEGLHRVGPDGTILWANKAEMNLLGYEPQEYIGATSLNFTSTTMSSVTCWSDCWAASPFTIARPKCATRTAPSGTY